MSIYRIRDEILWKVVDSEAVIVDPGKDEYSYLNPTGTSIWLMIDKGMDIKEIVSKLSKEYECDESNIREDMETLIEELISNNLIEAQNCK